MRHLKQIVPLTMLGLLSTVSLSALAEGTAAHRPQFYLGGGVGYGRVNGEDFTNTKGDLSESRVSWDALIGVKFNPVVSIEGEYIDFGAANRNSDRIKATGWITDIVLDIPVSTFITPYGKAGALFWKSDRTFNSIFRDDNGVSFNYGLGVRFKLTDNVDLRTEYMRYKLDGSHVDNVAANIQFNF